MTSDWRDRFRDVSGAGFPQLLDGDAAEFGCGLEEIRLKSGDTIKVSPVGVTALVGANNAGKSTLLCEVVAKLSHRPGHPDPETRTVDS